eukprot:scpid73662/ scgid28179/ 
MAHCRSRQALLVICWVMLSWFSGDGAYALAGGVCQLTAMSNGGVVGNCSGLPEGGAIVRAARVSSPGVPDMPSLTELYIEQSNLPTLPKELFKGLSSPSLIRKLSLRFNRIRNLPMHPSYFSIFTNSLRELDLSDNHIEIVGISSLAVLSNLTTLKLDRNHISVLAPNLLLSWPHLTYFSATMNQIEALPISFLQRLFFNDADWSLTGNMIECDASLCTVQASALDTSTGGLRNATMCHNIPGTSLLQYTQNLSGLTPPTPPTCSSCSSPRTHCQTTRCSAVCIPPSLAQDNCSYTSDGAVRTAGYGDAVVTSCSVSVNGTMRDGHVASVCGFGGMLHNQTGCMPNVINAIHTAEVFPPHDPCRHAQAVCPGNSRCQGVFSSPGTSTSASPSTSSSDPTTRPASSGGSSSKGGESSSVSDTDQGQHGQASGGLGGVVGASGATGRSVRSIGAGSAARSSSSAQSSSSSSSIS